MLKFSIKRVITMEKEIIYWENRLKEINEAIVELNIEKRNARKQLNRLKKGGNIVNRDNMKDRTIVETIYFLRREPNKLFTSKEILDHLKKEVGYQFNNFAPVFRDAQAVEPGITQIRRGYYMYKPMNKQ
jgi:uncharacterized coiled-coil protein SlyX